jgi:ribosomal protein L21
MVEAILSVKNRQFIAGQGQKIHVFNIDAALGSTFQCEVLGLTSDHTARGTARLKIIKHYLGEKKYWFRKTPRVGNRKIRGHRDHKTMLLVEEIKVA